MASSPGTIVNTSGVPVVDFVSVHVACFNESQIVAAQDAAVDTEILRLGESASFTTTAPIDPTTCSSFAIYAGGFPEDETANVQASGEPRGDRSRNRRRGDDIRGRRRDDGRRGAGDRSDETR